MVYDTKAIIPVEIGAPTSKIANMTLNQNKENIRLELDLIEERREVFFVKDVVLKRKIAIRYNKKVISYAFENDDLVLCKAGIGGKTIVRENLQKIGKDHIGKQLKQKEEFIFWEHSQEIKFHAFGARPTCASIIAK